MINSPVIVDGESIPFHQYINTIIKDFHDEKENIKNSFLAAEKTERKKTVAAIIASAIACIVCIALSVFACFQYRTYADTQIAAVEQELSEFAQKFEHIKAFNNGNLTFSDKLIEVSHVVLEQSSDIENTVVVSCRLTHAGTDYGIFINKDTTITIILKDGSVKECNVFNEKYPYSADIYLGDYLTKESTILPHEFYDTVLDDIAYIKLTNVGVWTYVQYQKETVSTIYEIEIYNAE
jgi:hypothetical protein